MKGKIDVTFTVTNYGADPKIITRALLRKANSTHKKGSIAGALVLKPRHEIAKYETFQLIAAKYGKLNELDQAVEDARGSVKLTVENMPAEFIHSKRKLDGSEYDAVIVNFGTNDAPHLRVFYLSDMQSELLQQGFKSAYDFTITEAPVEEDEGDEEEQEDEA